MPFFHCEHCGQHIETTPESSGAMSKCPTCSGSIIIPQFEIPSKTLPKEKWLKLNKEKVISSVSIATLLLFVLYLKWQKQNHENQPLRADIPAEKTRPEIKTQVSPSLSPNFETEKLSLFTIEGLSSNLPKTLKTDSQRPFGVKELTSTYKSFNAGISGISCSMTYFDWVHPIIQMDYLEENAKTMVKTERNVFNRDKDVIGFYCSGKKTTINGIQARRLLFEYHRGGSSKLKHHVLLILRNQESWMIQVFGDAERSEDVKTIADTIFQSVRF